MNIRILRSKKLHFICMLIIILVAGSLAGCGKAGPPRPPKNTRAFVWQNISADPSLLCLDVHATMSGMYSNLSAVVLELSAVSGPEDCPGCPFLTTEEHTVADLNSVFNPNTGTLHFSYCPVRTAPAYRYRLIGKNKHNTTQHAVSPESFVVMP